MAQKNTSQEPLPPFLRKSLKSGLINQGAVSENERPDTSVMESLNFHFDAIGSATLRKGSTLLGTNLGASILGLYYFVDTVNVVSPKSQMIVVAGSSAWYLSGATFAPIRTGLTATSKARFSTLLNYVFMVNGTESTAVWDGNTAGGFVTTGNALSAPKGQFIENFRARMWILGNSTYPARLFYSSIPSADATPTVTWDTDVATGQWIDISPSDGDSPTGLQRFKNVMLVFKTNRLYRVFDIGQVDPDPYYAVGATNQEGIIETKVGVFFHHATGFYQYQMDGTVQEISRPIWDIVRAIPVSTYANVAGWLEVDGDHVCWSVGSVTVNGTAYTNLVVRYTISSQVWTHYSYPTQIVTSVRRQPFYTDGTSQFCLTGDTAGNVLKMVTGNTDNATPIQYSLIHRWENIDGLLSTRKNVQIGNFTHYGGDGSNINFQIEESDPFDLNNWSNKVGQLAKSNTGFNSMDIKARKLRFRISGQSKGEPFIYNGFELLSVLDEFIQFNN